MNRIALLACIVLAGCPKASVPDAAIESPAPTAASGALRREPPTLEQLPPDFNLNAIWMSDVVNSTSPLEIRGRQVGELSVEQFSKEIGDGAVDWLPVQDERERVAFLKEPGTLADRELLAMSFSFYDGVLSQIAMTPRRDSDSSWIRDRLTEKFGAPEVPVKDYAVWRDKNATLEIEPHNVMLFSREIARKKEAADKARAKKDL